MSPRNNGSGKSRQQPAISTFFKTPQKRASSPVIDLTQDDDDGDLLPPSKRPRTSLAKQEASPGSDFAFDDDDDFPMELLDYPPSKASTSGPPNMSTSSAVTAERPQISKKVVVSDRSPVKKWQYHRRSATEVASPTTGDVVESETGQKNSRKMAFREKFLTKSTALEKQRSLQINEGGFSGGVSNEDGDSGGEMVEEAEEEEEESVTNFRRKHASTSKEKRKPDGKPAKGKGKKADEIGPSGQKYTPLEKQVRQASSFSQKILLTLYLLKDLTAEEGQSWRSTAGRSWI
jgi:DNA mismatch repair protein MSH3